MTSFTINIHNDSDLTPEVLGIKLNNCTWMTGQAVADPTAIANHKKVQGSVEPALDNQDYSGSLTVKYYFGEATVSVEFGVRFVSEGNHLKPLPFLSVQSSSNALHTSYDIQAQDQDFFGFVKIWRED